MGAASRTCELHGVGTRGAASGLRRGLALLFSALLLLAGSLEAAANQRIALIIGNAAYDEAPLLNPVNDARAIDQTLQGLGFETVTITDGDLEAMQTALLEFTQRIRDDATALVFFAGHGVQANGRNYLVPIDATLESEARLRFEALELNDVLEELDIAPSRINIIVLDACRNNPFLQRSRGGSRGLARVDAARGTLVAYATAPGAYASDGSGSNGLYTEHLLEALQTPGLQAEAVFKQVRIGVSAASGGAQVPWESSSLTGDFIFNQSGPAPGPATAVAAAPAPAAAAAVQVPGAIAAGAEVVFWDSIRDSEDAASYRAYLTQYPEGTFAGLARSRIDALERAPVPAVEPEPARIAPVERSAGLTLELLNDTGYTVVRVDASPSDSDVWGQDRLRGTPMPTGTERRIELGQHDSSIFDVRLTDVDGDTYTFAGVDVNRGLLRVTLSDIDQRDTPPAQQAAGVNDYYIDVTNSTGYTIMQLYVSPSASTQWGSDRLGTQTLPSGSVHRVLLPGEPSPMFDVRAVDVDGDSYTFMGIDVARQDLTITLDNLDGAGGTGTTASAGNNYYVVVTNSTGYTMMSLNVSHVSNTSWGQDWLGQTVLSPGQSHRVDLAGFESPMFDIRLTDEDGDTYTYRNVDISRRDINVTLADIDGR